MGLFGFLKLSRKEPPIRESEKPFYQPDSYYKDASYKGTEFEKRSSRLTSGRKSLIRLSAGYMSLRSFC